MGFYDSYDFSKFKFLSRIKSSPSIATPCQDFLNAIVDKKSRSNSGGGGSLVCAEIGIGVGATAFLATQKLSAEDTYYIFDFEDSVGALLEDLQQVPEIKCKLIAIGNSRKDWDSYNWNLSNLLLKMRMQDRNGMFDVVYLDGAHTFLHDGLAVCMLKEMIKPNGILILDDLFWTYKISPTISDLGKEKFPEEQFKAEQVLRVQDVFLVNDPNFKKLSHSKYGRGIFKRIN